MHRLVPLLVLGITMLLMGCNTTTEVDQGNLNKGFPKKSKDEIETELKKSPEAYKEYLDSQRKNAAYEQKGR